MQYPRSDANALFGNRTGALALGALHETQLALRAHAEVEAARRAAEVASRAAGVAGTVAKNLAALAAGDFVPMPRAPPSEEAIRPPEREEVKMEGLRTAFAWIWSCMTSLFWVCVFFLDIAIVIGMQIFLESIGQKRTGREIMSKKAMANALAKQAAQRGVSTGQEKSWWPIRMGRKFLRTFLTERTDFFHREQEVNRESCPDVGAC